MRKFSNWLIQLLVPDYLLEDIIGDMEEQYFTNLESTTTLNAQWSYFKDTISLLSSYTIKKRKNDYSTSAYSTTQNSLPMLRNYVKVALRNIAKQRLFTAINIIGLSAGMSIGILFITLISFIQTYDLFHENKDTIYRIITKTDNLIKTNLMASTPAPLGQSLKDDYTGFGDVVRINKSLNAEAVFNNKTLPVSGFFVDDNFLDIFTFDLLEGTSSLKNKYGVLITETFADKLFSEIEPLGKTISLGNLGEFVVTGILKDVPKNSHMRFEILMPYGTLTDLYHSGRIDANLEEWKDFNGNYTYIKLPQNNDLSKLKADLSSIANFQFEKIEQFNASFRIQHLSEVALLTDTKDEIGMVWGMELYWMSIGLTLLILLPACFNYANISTARALSRSKEIGMRKVIGGIKKQIFFQFIVESVIISLVSLFGAYAIFFLISPEFQSMLVGGSTSIKFDVTPLNFSYCLMFAIFTGVMSGLFPALHFAGIKPLDAFKKSTKTKLMGNATIQKSLMVIQFALSFGFIMGVVVFLDLYRTILNYDLGFNQESVLDIPLQDVSPEVLRSTLNQISAVQQVSMSSHVLGVNSNEANWFYYNQDSTQAIQMYIDQNYLNNFQLELLAGRNLMESPSGREQFALVNEEFLKRYNYKNINDAVGELLIVNDSTELQIAGVVKNFHFQNLSQKVMPFVFRSNSKKYAYANASIAAQDPLNTLNEIEEKWETISTVKFEAKFFEDEIDEVFNIYSNIVKIFLFLGFLAITISCLGLLAMVVYTTETRIKEVGVRKVMGASSKTITYLLSKDYLKLMIIASIIATPISYFLFSVLIIQQNAYSTGIGVWPVALSLVLLLTLGLITVVSQTWSAANSNPTDTLRHE